MGGAVHKRKLLKLVDQFEHHSDPAVRQLVQEERQRMSEAGAVT